MTLKEARQTALRAVQSSLLLEEIPPYKRGVILLPPTVAEVRLILLMERKRYARGGISWLVCARKRDTYLYLIGLMNKLYEIEHYIIAPRIALVGSKQRFSRSESRQDFVIHERDFLPARRRGTITLYEDRWDLLHEYYEVAKKIEKEDPLVAHEWFRHEYTEHEVRRKLRQTEFGNVSRKQLLDEDFDRSAIEDDPDVVEALRAIKDL